MVKYQIDEIVIKIRGKKTPQLSIDFFGNAIYAWLGSKRDSETVNLKYCPANESVCYHFVRDKNSAHYTHIDFTKEENNGKGKYVLIPHLYFSHQMDDIVRYVKGILKSQKSGRVPNIESEEIRNLIEKLNAVVKEIRRKQEQSLDAIVYLF